MVEVSKAPRPANQLIDVHLNHRGYEGAPQIEPLAGIAIGPCSHQLEGSLQGGMIENGNYRLQDCIESTLVRLIGVPYCCRDVRQRLRRAPDTRADEPMQELRAKVGGLAADAGRA